MMAHTAACGGISRRGPPRSMWSSKYWSVQPDTPENRSSHSCFFCGYAMTLPSYCANLSSRCCRKKASQAMSFIGSHFRELRFSSVREALWESGFPPITCCHASQAHARCRSTYAQPPPAGQPHIQRRRIAGMVESARLLDGEVVWREAIGISSSYAAYAMGFRFFASSVRRS
jgi:hypothetical protein